MSIFVRSMRKIDLFIIYIFGLIIYSNCLALNKYNISSEETDLIGELVLTETVFEDTLSDLARAYDQGYNEIKLANPTIDPWLPGEGSEIMIPSHFILPHAKRQGIVINVAEMRLYYYKNVDSDRLSVSTYPISIGRIDWRTPQGKMKITAKALDPNWYPPESIRKEHAEEGDELPRIVLPGPDNPLGRHAIQLSVPGYLIHGTNRPYGIGMRVTHGCIRMYPKDVERLFEEGPLGTAVEIVNQAYKVGVSGTKIFLEVHPELEKHKERYPDIYGHIVSLVQGRVKENWTVELDLEDVWEAVERANGIPTPVGNLKSSAQS